MRHLVLYVGIGSADFFNFNLFVFMLLISPRNVNLFFIYVDRLIFFIILMKTTRQLHRPHEPTVQ